MDNYGESKHSNHLRGKTLRVSYPGDSGSGYTVKTVAEGSGWYAGEGRSVDGSVVAFMHSIAAEVGATLEFHPVSNASRQQVYNQLGSTSSYTACVHEVALNETDFCIGNFWITNERLLMSTFSGTLYEDVIKLIVLTDDTTAGMTWWDWTWKRLRVPAKPFTPDVSDTCPRL
jgi:hypothetical protein